MTDLAVLLALTTLAATCHIAGTVAARLAPSMPRGLVMRAAVSQELSA